MSKLEQAQVSCPYCGESIEVLIDCSVSQQDYIEDCQVCCRPIRFVVVVEAIGDIRVAVYHEDE